MNYTIKTDILKRLLSVNNFYKHTTDFDLRELLNCVRLENKNGKLYAIATNHEIASIYYLGATQEPDGVCHIERSDVILKQCEFEIENDSSFVFNVIQEFAIGSAETTTGWVMDGNCCIFPDSTPMDGWRDWFPDSPVTKNKGVMYWDSDHIAALAASSPSGKLYFPQFIDVNKPIVVRDVYDDNWCGLFIPKPDVSQQPIKKGAEIPLWI